MKAKKIIAATALTMTIAGLVLEAQSVQAAKSFYITFTKKSYVYEKSYVYGTNGQKAIGQTPDGRMAAVVWERNSKTKAYGVSYINGKKYYLIKDKLAKPFSPNGQYVRLANTVRGKVKLKKIRKVNKKPTKTLSATIMANPTTGRATVTNKTSKRPTYNAKYLADFRQAFLKLLSKKMDQVIKLLQML